MAGLAAGSPLFHDLPVRADKLQYVRVHSLNHSCEGRSGKMRRRVIVALF